MRKNLIPPVKAAVFLAALVPLARLCWLGFSDGLGAHPVQFVTHSTGTWTLALLLITLSITPLRQLIGQSWPQQFRRMCGLFAFFYASLHFLCYVWLDQWFDWPAITKDIAKHPYVMVGFTAFMLLIPLAATSTQAMMQRLKRRWQQLHRLVYVIASLGVLHFLWLVKKDFSEPLIYGGILALLLGFRLARTTWLAEMLARLQQAGKQEAAR
jgi:sulfoxide reductase heme-binding subunit YedZ